MPLDFRYHLASLTAVFAALVIGILLGVAMTDAPGLSTQMEKLRDEFRASQFLRDIDQRTDQFNLRTQGHLVRMRLWGRNVILVQNASSFPNEKVDAVRQTLELAGANVIADISLTPRLLQLTPEQLDALYQRLGIAMVTEPGIEELMRQLVHDLGYSRTPIAAVLQKERLIRVRGDLAVPFSTVVYLGGGTGPPELSVTKIDLPFLQACGERQVRLAAAETLENTHSAIMAYRRVVPLTVDNVDRAAGRIALILALSNEQRGHFGYKPTATDVTPELD